MSNKDYTLTTVQEEVTRLCGLSFEEFGNRLNKITDPTTLREAYILAYMRDRTEMVKAITQRASALGITVEL